MLADTQPNLVDECLEMTEKVLFKNALPGVSLLDERRFSTRARYLYNNELTLDLLKYELYNLLIQPIDANSVIGGFRYLFNYVRGNIGFHRWGALKFFLMEYEQHIKGKGLPHVEWKNYYNVQTERLIQGLIVKQGLTLTNIEIQRITHCNGILYKYIFI